MRVTIEFGADENIVLPVNYNNMVQAFLYKHISDRDYQSFIHDEGYRIGGKQFKLFTFSRLLGNYRINNEAKKIVFSAPVSLVIAAAVEPFITDLAETLINTSNCNLGANNLNIMSIAVHRLPELKDKTRIKMLSPMTVYTTKQYGQQKKTQYYSPWREQFSSALHHNLKAKFEALYGEKAPADSFDITPIGTQEKRMKTITVYKGTIIEAYHGIYDLQGHPEIIRVAYNTGLGGKNAQGFGCWEVM